MADSCHEACAHYSHGVVIARDKLTCTKETTARKAALRLDFYGKFIYADGLFAEFLYGNCYSFAVHQRTLTRRDYG
jgi:hypothetical protein